MKKRILAFLLAVSIAVSVLVLPVSAASINNTALQTAITLGAVPTGQELGANITRGAFAKMLVSFSTYRESVSAQGTVGTLYRDVPGSSQWAPYIRIAVQQGWMNGYTDGSFRPDNTVTLEEACAAVLKMLSYKTTDLTGSFPQAQLNKAQQIGLRDQLTCTQGQAMTYEQCTLLLYNALRANTASGSAYGSSLGFTVSNGQVDTSSVLLKSRKGPFVAEEGTQLPFTPVSVYRNDKVSASAELNKYDVYYYSESLQTVWVYTRRAAGRITAVSPSASAPTALTVAGSNYTLGSSAVASKISSLNGGGVGEVVTLLLGMDNEVADVITGAEADSVFYGVVQTANRSLVEDNGADVLQKISVMCTDGITRTVNIDKSLNYPTGWLVEISVTPEGEQVTAIESKSVSGTINDTATALGDYALADDVQILDTTSEGLAGTVRPSRIAGTNLNTLAVRYYTLNEQGQIDRLILNDVTGDLWKYGVLDDVKNLAINAGSILGSLKGGSGGSGDGSSGSGSSGGSSSGSGSGSTGGSSSGSGSTSGSTTNTTTVVDDLRSVLVPTTSEILWGVIDGSLLSTVWNRITSSSGSLLSIGLKQLAKITGQPMSTILNFVGGGATYICYVNGSQASFSTSIKYPVLAGGLAVRQNVNGTVKAMIQLMPMKIDQVGAASVMSNGTRYETADDMQVYLWYKGQYYATKLSEVNSEGYYLTGWYDNFGCAAGKRVRVIVAVKKD
ncbi:S-layer homology domain-containing protein [Faecalibacterium sp. OM04-11BH]|uniref:S-layer homology domain-containing protein n=1 Tax=Faecalibacterium sp. OM04-11BH TaxID=2292357 RepID=UPI000E4D47D4|nr:S-layer homology domain-containing protein [Faecalibacterium sp. OM04-11BH]RHV55386.1 S-layer homology domain-containing protein [Faecalibacterium sp. OM04-11BH]